MPTPRLHTLIAPLLACVVACGAPPSPTAPAAEKQYSAEELRQADRICQQAERRFDEIERQEFAPRPEGATEEEVIAAQKQAWRELREDFTRCINLNPHGSRSYMSRGDTSWGLGDFEAALGDYTKAFEISGDPTALYARGYTLARLGRIEAAKADQRLLASRQADYAARLTEVIYLVEARARADQVSQACGVASGQEHRCEAWENSFVDADVQLIFATSEEVNVLYPGGVGPEPPRLPEEYLREPPVSDEARRASEELRQSLPHLSCFSVTDIELDALGDALGLQRPEAKPGTRPSPQEFSRLLKAFGGSPETRDEASKQKALASHLRDARHFPGGCGAVYELPDAMVRALSELEDSEELGTRWNARILANGPNPWVGGRPSIASEPTPASGEDDPRDQVRAWQSIAAKISRFTREARCDARKLYVEIWFDC